MNFDEVKIRIKEICDFSDTLPDAYKDRVFQILINYFENEIHPSKIKKQDLNHPKLETPPENNPTLAPEQKSPTVTNFIIPAKVRVFLQRNKIDEAILNKVVMIEDGVIHFINEPSTNKIAAGQIQWSLLLALKEALSGQDFIVDTEAVRSICIEKGLYDRSNFAANFRNKSALYQSVPESQGEPVKISKDGEVELASILKSLAN